MKSLSALLILAVLSATVCADEKAADEKQTEKPAEQKDKPAKKVETKDLKVKELTLKFPKTWEKVDHPSRMRLATIKVPKVNGDSDDGELTIFNFGGGGGQVEANIQRWVGQFQNEGREVTVQQGKAGENSYIIVDVSGTFKKSDGPPILGKTKPVKGYQMLGVILLHMKSSEVFYLKLTGPRKTITAAADAYRASFGGSTKNEKPLSTKD